MTQRDVRPLAIFRTDASISIGGGHVYRCLTLANALREQGYLCHFIGRHEPGNLAPLISSQGFSCHLLGADSTFNQQTDAIDCRHHLAHLISETRNSALALLIVDHYQISATWHQLLSPLSQKLIVLDDLANRKYACDLLFDQSLARQAIDYQPWLNNSDTKLVLGATHALLRPQFNQLRASAIEKRRSGAIVSNLLIALSATDPDNISLAVLQQLCLCPAIDKFSIQLVLTSQAPHLQQLQKFIEQHQLPVQLLVDVDNMAQLMLKADLAIAAAGTALLERCCLGLPSLVLILADNQQHIAKAVQANQVAIAVLASHEISTKLNQELSTFLHAINYSTTAPQYQKLAQQGFALCDGSGVHRLSQTLVEPVQADKCWLAPVTLLDAKLLYQWQCAPTTRQYARTKTTPSWSEHQTWLSNRLANRDCYFYLVYHKHQALGYVRIQPKKVQEQAGYEVSIALAPSAYGQGIGTKALRLLQQLHAEKILFAYIEAENLASIALFTKVGYQLVSENWYQLSNVLHTDNE